MLALSLGAARSRLTVWRIFAHPLLAIYWRLATVDILPHTILYLEGAVVPDTIIRWGFECFILDAVKQTGAPISSCKIDRNVRLETSSYRVHLYSPFPKSLSHPQPPMR